MIILSLVYAISPLSLTHHHMQVDPLREIIRAIIVSPLDVPFHHH